MSTATISDTLRRSPGYLFAICRRFSQSPTDALRPIRPNQIAVPKLAGADLGQALACYRSRIEDAPARSAFLASGAHRMGRPGGAAHRAGARKPGRDLPSWRIGCTLGTHWGRPPSVFA
jgi:hypothetical protein